MPTKTFSSLEFLDRIGLKFRRDKAINAIANKAEQRFYITYKEEINSGKMQHNGKTYRQNIIDSLAGFSNEELINLHQTLSTMNNIGSESSKTYNRIKQWKAERAA